VAGGMELMSVYGFSAAMNVVIMVLIMRMWPANDALLNQQSGIGFFASLAEVSNAAVLIRLMLIAIIVGVNGLYNILLGLLILNNLGGTEADVGWFAGGAALAEAPVMLMAAIGLRYVTRSGAILVGCVVYCGFLAGFAGLSDMAAAWWMIIPAGIGAGILLSVTVGYVQELVADRPGAGSSLVAVSHFGGTIFAAATFAGAAAFTGYQGTAWIGAGIVLCAGLLLFVMDGRKLRKTSTAFN